MEMEIGDADRMARGSHWRPPGRTNENELGDTKMKTSRYAIVLGTLLLSALAGTSTAGTVQRIACHADAMTRMLSDQPAPTPAPVCR
jgi:hypothetical protein